MLPDYFLGTGGIQINLNLDKNTTFGELFDQLEGEVYNLYDTILSIFDCMPGSLVEAEIKRFLTYIKENNDFSEIYDSSLDWDFEEDIDDTEEMPVLIMSIESA